MKTLVLALALAGCAPVAVAVPPDAVPTVQVALTPTLSPAPPATPPAAVSSAVAGLASWVVPAYGDDYVALPAGPGIAFRVCGAGGCWESVSTDAGPDRAMQRAGRVIDLAARRWAQVCGIALAHGLCPVTVVMEE